MTKDIFPRGSEWRKWDLHVHAPCGHKHDRYKTTEAEDVLEKFCDLIEASDVRVVGITDYFSVEGYNKFIEKFTSKYPDSEKIFFFNLELRLNETVNRELEEVNTHLIFNPKSLEKIEKFLSSLNVVKTGRDEVPIACSELKNEDYESATVTRKNITDAFEATFGKKAIRQEHFLVLTAANNDGLRPERGKQRKEGICDEIDKFSDGFFGGSQNVDYYLDEDRLEDKDIKIAQKPVVAGSDSHSFEDLKNKLGKTFASQDHSGNINDSSEITWIKANPTFEGLRQIIFEPQARVKLQESVPEEKDLYRVIESLEINDDSFTNDSIKLNPGLNVIIGSRSSGKSTLLGCIAKSIDIQEYEERDAGLIQEPPFAKITWNDESVSSDDNQKGITYIPQNYINKLAEATDKKAPILSIAESAIFEEGDTLTNEKKSVEETISSINKEIEEEVFKMFQTINQIEALEEDIKKIGDKKGIQKQIEKIDSEITKLQKDLSEEDIKKLTKLRQEYSENRKKLEELTEDISTLGDEIDFIDDNPVLFEENDVDLKSKEIQDEIEDYVKDLQSDYIGKYKSFIEKKKEELEKEKSTLTKKHEKSQKDNKDLIDKSKENKAAEAKVADKKTQEKKLSEIIKAEENLEKHKVKKTSSISKISELHLKRVTTRKEFAQKTKGSLEGIEFSAKVTIDSRQADKFLEDNVNFHHSVEAKPRLNNINGYQNELEGPNHLVLLDSENIEITINLILDDSLKIKAGSDKKQVITGILRDYGFINYSLSYEGDEYSEMTPGKKSLVVLKLLVETSEDKYPILIDQPEDDLDSRSISSEIVEFLREKKKTRQIILVTHNANIAIKADAEEIIVANRHSDDYSNEDAVMFNYRTGAIEDSFVDDNKEHTLDKMGIREHACELLEGGEDAFESRRNKYNLK